MQKWDPLTTTPATACLTLESTSTHLGVGPSTLTSALRPTASTGSPRTCGDRALRTYSTNAGKKYGFFLEVWFHGFIFLKYILFCCKLIWLF